MQYSQKRLDSIMADSVYPDGVQNELTAHYHYVALLNFEKFANTCTEAGIELPESFKKRLLLMWNYLALTMRPDGYALMNNDSDRKFMRRKIMNAADRYKRDDWLYIASNGSEGKSPTGILSSIFPWAGQLLMHSGYNNDAQWAFFDIGPWGECHQHNDKLHISIAAYGRDLLVDSGRFSYSGEIAAKFRNNYALHSASHNVILIDEQGQNPGPLRVTQPISKDSYRLEKDFDYARSSYNNFAKAEGDIKHTRALFYLRNEFWVVVDRIDTDRPRKLEVLWHWHPDCNVTEQNGRSFSTDPEKGNLEIIPLGKINWDIDIVKGQEKPRLQGWYSEKYNKVTPSPTAVY